MSGNGARNAGTGERAAFPTQIYPDNGVKILLVKEVDQQSNGEK
ncbi:hypothetical protein [Burkholderia sp. Ac-20345]|nr:hypothetical protein [Burkholderia sp. Ac-20345]